MTFQLRPLGTHFSIFLIQEKHSESERQKLLLAEKNKDIMDSIRYAKRIQHSLLPTDKYIDRI